MWQGPAAAAPAGAARRSEEAALWAEEQEGGSGAEAAQAAAELEEWEAGESGSDSYSSGEEEYADEEGQSSSEDGDSEGETGCRPGRQHRASGSCLWREVPAGSGQLARGISPHMLMARSCCMPSECQEPACVCDPARGLLTQGFTPGSAERAKGGCEWAECLVPGCVCRQKWPSGCAPCMLQSGCSRNCSV